MAAKKNAPVQPHHPSKPVPILPQKASGNNAVDKEGPAPNEVGLSAVDTLSPERHKSRTENQGKANKSRLVVSIPEEDHERMAELKRTLVALGAGAKKSELISVGIRMLSTMPPPRLLRALDVLHSKRLIVPKSLGRAHLKQKKK